MQFNKEKIKNGFLILSWALYDLANQFFVLNVVSLYFVRWLTLEKRSPEILYSLSFGASSFLVAISAPILGTISDMRGRHKPFLVYLTILSVVFTALLGSSENVFLNLLFFAIANLGCQLAIVFYNALMVNISPPSRLGLISGLGRVFSYSGAILALYLMKPIVLKKGYQATFFPTGFFFLIFSLPCLIFIKDRPLKEKIDSIYFFKKEKIFKILRDLKINLWETYKFPGMKDFLKAAFFGLCAVNVVTLFMSIYATKVFGLNEAQIINLIAFSTIFAIISSFFSGYLSDYIGYKRCLSATFILWAICFSLGAFARNIYFYWSIGALVGIALGSIWVVSRALAVKLVPEEKIGEVFGLFNLVGYLSAIIGTIFWGLILWFLSPLGQWSYRIALFSLNLFMVLGFIFILNIPQDKHK